MEDRMAKIDASRLKSLRKKKGWSQEELAEKTKIAGQAKIDKQTISRLERGAGGDARGRTIQQLARALGVQPAVLTGESPVSHADSDSGPSAPKSQFNVRVSRSARNAFTLLSQRYPIQPWQIVELAPFLFFWAAETSLRRRREAIDQFERARSDLVNRGRDIPHVFAAYDLWDAPIEEKLTAAERASIDIGDLFGKAVFEETALWPGPDAEDPFSVFLRNLIEDFDDDVEFNGWDWEDGSPDYRVCVESATRLAGGDESLAEMILRGFVALHEMPLALRAGEEKTKERVEWMRANVEQYAKELEEEKERLKADNEEAKRSTMEGA
jgi:transcriptional regulator with XRE-family HTH domain